MINYGNNGSLIYEIILIQINRSPSHIEFPQLSICFFNKKQSLHNKEIILLPHTTTPGKRLALHKIEKKKNNSITENNNK